MLAWFLVILQKNVTNLGEFTIESGSSGLDELGYIREWNKKQALDYWNDTYCDMINGSGYLYFILIICKFSTR